MKSDKKIGVNKPRTKTPQTAPAAKIQAAESPDIQQKAADAILDAAGVDFTVTVSNPGWLHRIGLLPTERNLVIRQIKTGVAIMIASELFSIDGFIGSLSGKKYSEVAYQGMMENTDALVRAIALAIINREPNWFTRFRLRRLRRYLRNNLSWSDMLQLMTLVVQQMRIDDFFYTMALTQGANVLAGTKAAATKKETDGLTPGKLSGASSTTSAPAGMKSSGK